MHPTWLIRSSLANIQHSQCSRHTYSVQTMQMHVADACLLSLIQSLFIRSSLPIHYMQSVSSIGMCKQFFVVVVAACSDALVHFKRITNCICILSCSAAHAMPLVALQIRGCARRAHYKIEFTRIQPPAHNNNTKRRGKKNGELCSIWRGNWRRQ